jgi:hypothetical protein
LIVSLRNVAARMIEHVRAEAILICQQTDDPERVIWTEHVSHESGSFSRIIGQAIRSSCRAISDLSPARPLEFVDGFYHFPLPPCRVWSLELHPSAGRQLAILQHLLELSRKASQDAHAIGMSLYKAADNSPIVVSFLALHQEISPNHFFSQGSRHALETAIFEPIVAWHPLAVKWSVGRLSYSANGSEYPAHYPRTMFWARSSQRALPGLISSL